MIVASLVLVVLSIAFPLVIHACATGRIRVNPLAGIRIPSLMASEDAWRAGHRASLPTVWIGAPIALVIAAVSLVPALPEGTQSALVLTAAAVLIATAVVGGVFANRAALAVPAVPAVEHEEQGP